MSGGGLTLLSSNSAATVAVRIDPDRSEDLSMTRATIRGGFHLILQSAVSTSVSRWLTDLDYEI